MRSLVWGPAFARAVKRTIARQPDLRDRLDQALNRLEEDPFQPVLRSHKLKGELAGTWACTVDYDHRVLFEVVCNPNTGDEEILLLGMGTLDEVY